MDQLIGDKVPLKLNIRYLEGTSLAIVITLIFSTFFALIGYLNILKIPLIIAGIVFCLFYIRSNKSKEVVGLNIILLMLFIVFSIIFFHSYTINAGRDNGVYLNSAILVSNTGSYYFKDKIIETFPGFVAVENELTTTQFLPGYIVYLSFFSSNIHLIYLGNGILYFFILFFIYSITKKITSERGAIICILLFSTFYTSLWIIRNTFSEILMSFLFWFSIYLLLKEDPQKKMWSILPMTLCLLVRVETLIYFVPFFCVYLFINRHNLLKNRKLFFSVASLLSVIFFSLLILLSLSPSYYTGQVNQGIQTLSNLLLHSGQENPRLQVYETYPYAYYLNRVLVSYNLVAYFPLIFILFPYLMRHKKSKVNIYLLLVIYLPSIIFIFRPMITPDHPWFMRRFWAVHIPLLLMLSIYMLHQFPRRVKVCYVLFLIISNLLMISPILSFSDDYNSIENIEDFLKGFGNNSAFIFPCGSGNTFSTYIYAKHGLNATVEPTYWPWLGDFYPNNKLNKETVTLFFGKNEKVYLVSLKSPDYLDTKSPISRLFDNADLNYLCKYNYSVKKLISSCDYVPQYLEGKATLELIASKCVDLPPSKIQTINKTFYIYNVNLSP